MARMWWESFINKCNRKAWEIMIEVTNLTKKYGKQIAVDHLSFRVEKGQI